MYILPLKLAPILFVMKSYAATTVAQPVDSQALSLKKLRNTISEAYSNNNNLSTFNKRVAAIPFRRQDVSLPQQKEHMHEKRYWEVTSVWIPEVAPAVISRCQHTVIETVTVTADVLETSYVAPVPTDKSGSLPDAPDSLDTVNTPSIVEPVLLGPPPFPSFTSSAPNVRVKSMKAGPTYTSSLDWQPTPKNARYGEQWIL